MTEQEKNVSVASTKLEEKVRHEEACRAKQEETSAAYQRAAAAQNESQSARDVADSRHETAKQQLSFARMNEDQLKEARKGVLKNKTALERAMNANEKLKAKAVENVSTAASTCRDRKTAVDEAVGKYEQAA